MTRKGTRAISVRPGLLTFYGVDGRFEQGAASGVEPQSGSDDGTIKGTFGLNLVGEIFLTDRVALDFGIEYRTYEVQGLNPIVEIPILVDDVASLQVNLGLRYLLDPLECNPRLRPWIGAGISYLPETDLGFDLDLSSLGLANIRVDAKGSEYFVGSLAGGVLYQIMDRMTLEAGLIYEFPLTQFDADLTFEPLSGTTIPFFAELDPSGVIGFCGITWYL